MNEAFQKDCLEILADKVKRGEISRRRFAQVAAMLLAGAPALMRRPTRMRRPTNSCSSTGAATP